MSFSAHHYIPELPAYILQNILSTVMKNFQIQPQVILDSTGLDFSGLEVGTKIKLEK